jgi:hypothetical protein
VFLERIRPSLGGLTDALVALGESRDRPAGNLRLNVPRVASVMFVGPVLAASWPNTPTFRSIWSWTTP